MALHNELGKTGEELAVTWLMNKGYNILHQNWRFKHLEIDIIAGKENFLYFIEVKARNFSRYGHPEDSVTKKKFKHLQKAADEYLFQHPGHPWIQYAVLSITLQPGKEPAYFFIEDLFM